MARSIQDIQQLIYAQKAQEPALENLNSTSKVAIWRLWVYIISVAIWSLEKELKADKFTLQNEMVDFKTLLNDLLTELKNAIIQTPAGPGNFAPQNVAKFEEINNKIKQLWH